jgi:hypothetical protein
MSLATKNWSQGPIAKWPFSINVLKHNGYVKILKIQK